MAQFLQSIYTPNMSGSVGGFTFSRNRFGAYQKIKPIPTNPRSAAQRAQRELAASVSKEWWHLGNAQKLVWTEIAQQFPVNGKILSGFLFFMQLNLNLQNINEAIILDCPQVLGSITPMTTFTVDIDLTVGNEDIKMNFTPAIPVTEKVKVFATMPLVKNQKAKESDYRLITVVDSTFVTAGSIKTAYVNKFGTIPEEDIKASFRIQPIVLATGYAGAKYYADAVGTV